MRASNAKKIINAFFSRGSRSLNIRFHLVGLVIVGCSSSGGSPVYLYPLAEEQEARRVCELVYEPEYAVLLGNARQSPISKIVATEKGVIVFFLNGHIAALPIQNSLPHSKSLYCDGRSLHPPCIEGDNWDKRCRRKTRR